MDKKKIIVTTAAALLMSGCSGGQEQADIQIPALDADSGLTAATAERYDIVEYVNFGADVGYAFAETLTVPYDTNVVEYNVKIGDRLSEGDVIAVFDASSFDYDIKNQEAVTDSSYSAYLSSGSEISRLEYEENKKYLELLKHNADSCTIRAPYDCIVCGTEIMTVGAAISAGSSVCRIARPDEVFITVNKNTDQFAFGMPVLLKFGTQSEFSGRVVMEPENSRDGVLIRLDDGELERANDETGGIATAGWGTVMLNDYTAYNVLCVPEKAVMSYLGETYCYIDDGNGKGRVPVETGKTVNGITVILSGLTDGDTVLY